MNKDRLNTTSIREIKSSFRRFLSLLVMSMLGVGVFVGLKMSSPDMIKSLDTYYDNKDMYDVKVISTLGLTNDDLNEIKRQKYVKDVHGSYSKDVLLKNGIHESVTKVIGITDKINKIDIIKGKLPKTDNETVVEEAMLTNENIKIGDTIEILDKDTFKETNLTIVGIVKSPLYIGNITAAPNRGNTNLGSGKISYYIYVNSSNFKLDYYTEAYITSINAKEEETNSKKYKGKVNNTINSINKIKNKRQNVRYDEIYNKYKDEIEKNKLACAKELNQAENKLYQAKQMLKQGKEKLDNVKLELDNAKVELDSNKTKLVIAKDEINSAQSIIEEYGITLDDINKVRNFLKDNDINEEDVINTFEEVKPYYDLIIENISDSNKEDFTNYITSDSFKDIINDNSRLDLIRTYINDDNIISAIKDNINDLSILDNTPLTEEEKELIRQSTIYNNIKEFINDDNNINKIREYINNDELISKIKNIIITNLTKENIDKITNLTPDDLRNLLNNIDDLNNGIKAYDDGLITYNEYYNKYQNGLSEYNNAVLEYNRNLNLYNSNIKKYYDSRSIFELKIKEAEGKLTEIPEARWYVQDRMDMSEYADFIDAGKSVSNLSKAFPSIFFIVAILVSLISMSRMVEDGRGEIGTLKSLGFNNRHIRKKYIIYSGLATLLGSLIGGTLGYVLLPYIIFNIYKIMFAVPVFRYKLDISSFALGTIIALICICGTTLLTIKKVVKEKPSDLMRPKAPKNGKRVFLEKIPLIWNRISFSNKITIRNLSRYKKRVIMTIFGIIGCTALMLIGYGIRDSIVDIPEKQFKEIYHFDDMAYITGNPSIETLDNIFNNRHIKEKYYSYMMVSDEEGEYGINIFVPYNTSDLYKIQELRDKKTKKKIELKDGFVVISDKIAELKNKKVGDLIEVKDNKGKSHKFKISGISENYAGHYVFMSKNTYEKEMGTYETNMVYYMLDNKKNDSKVSKALLKSDNIMTVISIDETMDNFSDMLKSLNSVVFILIILSGSLTFVVLYNLSYINITERKREIATLKVLGFTDKEVDNYVIKETIILTIVGIIFGILLGVILTYKIVNTIEVEMVRFLHSIDLSSYITTCLFILLFTLVVNIIIHFYLRKIDMIESLKSVE